MPRWRKKTMKILKRRRRNELEKLIIISMHRRNKGVLGFWGAIRN